VKILNNVLEEYEKNRQKTISSLERNRKLVAKKLLEDYVGFSYITLLDNTTKAQVSFSQNAHNLLDIEQKEVKQLDNFKTIKEILIEDRDNLNDKIVILDAIAIEKQQYLFDLKNLEAESKDKNKSLGKEQSFIRDGWREDISFLNKKILKWEIEREKSLTKDEEQRLYEHNLKILQIKDSHEDELAILNREQELKSRGITKDINIKRKELQSNLNIYEDAKEYLDKFEESISAKVSKQIKIKLGFIKQDHENRLKSQENNFSNQLDILDLKIENLVKNSEEKRVAIKELKDKLAIAKAELNQLTQNTLSI
jgi:hypothetical protein